ncbi:hypothetical protein ACFQO9_05895 [Chryseobacterium zhengzhouense]|uniref:Uncharacterized protein n=1 Tax=Chryseobacterium zhengzhouense TaxID=1636086 RepID=A0ABW2LX20_9FLAO
MKKTVVVIAGMLVVFVFGGGMLFCIFKDFFFTRSEFDIPDQPNDKIIAMFNTQIEKQIEDHTHSPMHPGYIPESRENTIQFLKTIKTIESMTRFSVLSKQPRNYLELKISFADGSVAEEVYTGQTCNGYLAPCLLMKVEMDNGKAVKVFTNGQEKKGSPDWIINDLNLLIDKSISYDITQNNNKYFPPQKTDADFEKEWENRK